MSVARRTPMRAGCEPEAHDAGRVDGRRAGSGRGGGDRPGGNARLPATLEGRARASGYARPTCPSSDVIGPVIRGIGAHRGAGERGLEGADLAPADVRVDGRS